ASASSTASTSLSPRRSNCRTHCSGLSASPFPEKPRPPRTSMPALLKSAPRCPRRTGPSSTNYSARPAAYRATYTAKDVPPFLGPPKPPPPDLAALPPAVGRLMHATFIALGHLFGSSQAPNEEKVLYGLAAGGRGRGGRGGRVSGPSDCGRTAKGDVLVTQSTTEAFNILL